MTFILSRNNADLKKFFTHLGAIPCNLCSHIKNYNILRTIFENSDLTLRNFKYC